MKFSWGKGYLYSLKIYLNKLLMNYKGKKGTFTVEKSGGHQVIKVNITNNGINWHHVPPDVMHWGHNITYVLFLPKMHNLKLVIRKQSDKPKTEGQSTKQLTYTLEKCQCAERQEALELSVWSWIGSWIRKQTVIKDINATQDNWWIWIWTILDNGIILMLNCLISNISLQLSEIISLFLGETSQSIWG